MVTAVRGADVQVAAGEMLAVMGPSGSGKSTLLHCLAGIFAPDEGQITFDGQRLDQMDETRRTVWGDGEVGGAPRSASCSSSGSSCPN